MALKRHGNTLLLVKAKPEPQLEKENAMTEPMPQVGSPLPDFRLPLSLDAKQLI
jgi:hypothetical protein